MSDKLRQRARKLAEDARYRLEDMGVTNAIEAAILAGMREAQQEGPCKTCEALARAVMTDQMGRA